MSGLGLIEWCITYNRNNLELVVGFVWRLLVGMFTESILEGNKQIFKWKSVNKRKQTVKVTKKEVWVATKLSFIYIYICTHTHTHTWLLILNLQQATKDEVSLLELIPFVHMFLTLLSLLLTKHHRLLDLFSNLSSLLSLLFPSLILSHFSICLLF